MPPEEPTVTSGGSAPPAPPHASAPTRAPHPDRIGPYRITRVLGQGGMGAVNEAEQLEPLRLIVSLLLGVTERPSARAIAHRARDAPAALLQLHQVSAGAPR